MIPHPCPLTIGQILACTPSPRSQATKNSPRCCWSTRNSTTPKEGSPISTYLFLECLDHDPPLRAAGESGQHLSDLPQIRADIAARDALLALVAASEWGDIPDLGTRFRQNTADFLVAHPRCRIGIRDEYGDEHPITEGEQA